MGFANSNFHRQIGRMGAAEDPLVLRVDLPFMASGQRMVARDPSTLELVYADRLEDHAQTVLGFLLEAGSLSVPVLVAGVYEDPTMVWNPNYPLWLDEEGQLTQTRPTSGFLLQVGRVLTEAKILIDIQSAIRLA
jgi:hypothetical protein